MNRKLLVVFFLISAAFLASTAGTTEAAQLPEAWRGRRIYQLMTDRFYCGASNNCSTTCCTTGDCSHYCGGTWKGVQDKLSYIAALGFNAIWISPIPAQVGGTSSSTGYHGYWMGKACGANHLAHNVSDNDCINQHFGSMGDLKSLIAAAHAMDIWVMADVVINHVGPVGNDFSRVYPFNDSRSYHQDCAVTQYQCLTTEIEHCRLANLPDLDQDNPTVMQQLLDYVQWTLSLGFDGLRLDTVMYVKPKYWKIINEATNTLMVGEVWSQTWKCEHTYASEGAITSTLNYGLFDALHNVFLRGQSMRQLGTQWRQVKAMPFPSLSGSFLNNQDNDMWLGEHDSTHNNYMSALSHSFFQEGIPILWQGSEQLDFTGKVSDNTNRRPLWLSHFDTTNYLYLFTKMMNNAYVKFNLGHAQVEERWQDDQVYCFLRGDILHCASNTQGTAQTRVIPNLPSSWNGRTICNWYDQGNGNCMKGATTMSITVSSDAMPLLLFPSQ